MIRQNVEIDLFLVRKFDVSAGRPSLACNVSLYAIRKYNFFSPIKNCKPISPLLKENYEYNHIYFKSITAKKKSTDLELNTVTAIWILY